MKLIKYMKIVPVDEEYYFLVNGLNGVIDTIDQEGYQICQQWQGIDQIIPTTERERSAYNYLLSRGYIMEPGEDEQKKLELLDRGKTDNNNQIFLNFVITYDCNFRCKYCYEKNLLHKGETWLKTSMDLQMIQDIYDYIDRKQLKLNHPGLYGGEPLLIENHAIVQEILERNSQRGLDTICVSNGYYLSEFVPLLAEHKISQLHITLDGPRKIHNKNRFTCDGQGTFDKIIDGIKTAVDAGLPICVRSNVYMGEEKYIDELIDYFRATGLTDKKNITFYINPVFGSTNGGCQNIEQVLPEYLSLYDRIEDLPILRQDLLYRIHPLASAFLGDDSWKPKRIFCGASSRYHLIDPFGQIYPCQSLVGIEEQAIGHFDGQEIVYNQNYDKWQNRSIDKMPKCNDCWAGLICGGDCGYRAFEEYGNISHSVCRTTESLVKVFLPYLFKKFVLPKIHSKKGGD